MSSCLLMLDIRRIHMQIDSDYSEASSTSLIGMIMNVLFTIACIYLCSMNYFKKCEEKKYN